MDMCSFEEHGSPNVWPRCPELGPATCLSRSLDAHKWCPLPPLALPTPTFPITHCTKSPTVTKGSTPNPLTFSIDQFHKKLVSVNKSICHIHRQKEPLLCVGLPFGLAGVSVRVIFQTNPAILPPLKLFWDCIDERMKVGASLDLHYSILVFIIIPGPFVGDDQICCRTALAAVIFWFSNWQLGR